MLSKKPYAIPPQSEKKEMKRKAMFCLNSDMFQLPFVKKMFAFDVSEFAQLS